MLQIKACKSQVYLRGFKNDKSNKCEIKQANQKIKLDKNSKNINLKSVRYICVKKLKLPIIKLVTIFNPYITSLFLLRNTAILPFYYVLISVKNVYLTEKQNKEKLKIKFITT